MPVELDSDLLEANYQHFLNAIPPHQAPNDQLKEAVAQIHTTHTFGAEKNWGTETIFPYQNILIAGEGLLSDAYRKKKNKYKVGEPVRTMEEVRTVKLDEYVFAYLGLHENYYAKSGIAYVPAFGVFLPRALDFEPNSNVTVADLTSPKIKGYPPEKVFLTPERGRDYAAHLIANAYSNAFFDYWICPDYIAQNFIQDKKWEHKVEFHYHNKVEIRAIDALLWPDFYPSKVELGAEMELVRTQFPNLTIYIYPWDQRFPVVCFSVASFVVSEYFYQTGSYLNQKEFIQRYQAHYSQILDKLR